MQDTITTIDTRCEAPETDISYEGAHLSAEYDADYDCTEISGQTYPVKDALRGLDGARWTGSAWIVDGNRVAHVRNADAHWVGGRTTLVRRIASALREPARDECKWVGSLYNCTVGEVTEAATCAAIDLTGEAEAAEPAARRIAVSLRSVVLAAAKGAAHAVRSARARRAWETRRRNAARQAEALSATCEPLVVDAATPSAELCHGRTAHGVDGRVVDTPRGADHLDGYPMVYGGRDDVQILVDHTLRRVDTSRCPRVWVDATETYPVRVDAPCLTPAEGRRERRNARRRELYRQRRAA